MPSCRKFGRPPSGRSVLPAEGAREARLMTRGSDEVMDGEPLRTRADAPCADEGAWDLTPTPECHLGCHRPGMSERDRGDVVVGDRSLRS